jgi:hypothetical protein
MLATRSLRGRAASSFACSRLRRCAFITERRLETKRVNIDLPAHFLDKLDHCAAIRGLTPQALIKSWLYDRLEEVALAAAQRALATLERKRIQPKKSVERPHILPRAMSKHFGRGDRG